MINPFAQINWNPDKTSLRLFGRVVLTGLCVIGLICSGLALYTGKPVLNSSLPLLICSMAGLAIYGLSLTGTKAGKAVYVLWFVFGASFGIVISNVVLVLFFYLFFSPYACIARVLTGRDLLRLRLRDGAGSNWVDVKDNETLSSYFRQY